jgi:3-oxoacyl-[acyl-carrier-protein] synthase II
MRCVSRSDRLAIWAALEALREAGWHDGAHLSDRTAGFAVSLGSTTGGMQEAEDAFLEAARGAGLCAAPSSGFRSSTCCHPARAVAGWGGFAGPCIANTTACSSGAWAVAIAAELIRAGEADAALCGGADALCRLTLSGFGALRLLDPEPCRPFDASRAGLSLGEGAGILLLEDWELARRRGARVLAEYLDYGASCDAVHLTASDPAGTGAAEAVRAALGRSGVEPSQVDYINAHGTGTPLNDASEVAAIRQVFGGEARRIPVSSSKSLFGHALGAAGGMEAVLTVTALETQTLPPTRGWRSGEEGFDLDVVPARARPAPIRVALSNNFGFGGGNVTLAFRKAA